MPYTIDTVQPIWRVTFRGSLTDEDLTQILKDAEAIELHKPVIANRIVDFRALESIKIGFPEMNQFVERRRRFSFPNSFRTAILTDHPVQYGVARMFQTLLEHPQICVSVFKDEEQAIRWLSKPA